MKNGLHFFTAFFSIKGTFPKGKARFVCPPLWRPCRGSPSRAKLVPGLHIKGLSNKSPDRCRRRGFTVFPPTGGIINSLPLKGKRLTTFCASLTLLQNVFAVHRKAAIHNPRAKGPSNLRTLRPIGPVHLKNLFLGTLRTLDTKCPSFTISPLTWPPDACILLSN